MLCSNGHIKILSVLCIEKKIKWEAKRAYKTKINLKLDTMNTGTLTERLEYFLHVKCLYAFYLPVIYLLGTEEIWMKTYFMILT